MRIPFFILILLFFSCKKENYFDGPEYFKDDFENYNQLEDLLLDDDQLWSYTQLTLPENNISVDTSFSLTGNKCLKFSAKKSDELLSKCSIAKQKMAFYEGETVQIKINYFLPDTLNHEWFFLLDLEEQVAIGAGPGVRLALVDNKIRMEYKFLESDVTQNAGSEIDFPRNQWVEIIWELKLSQKNKGFVKVFQNGILIIEKDKIKTLPTDILYSQQGTKGMYSSIEIGITANSYDNDLILFADDFEIKRI